MKRADYKCKSCHRVFPMLPPLTLNKLCPACYNKSVIVTPKPKKEVSK